MDRLTAAGIIELSGGIEKNNTFSYITRGLGTSNLDTELRLFASPEIVVINPSASPLE